MELNGNSQWKISLPWLVQGLGVRNSHPHDSWLMAKQYFMSQCTLPPAHCSKNPTEPTSPPSLLLSLFPLREPPFCVSPPKNFL